MGCTYDLRAKADGKHTRTAADKINCAECSRMKSSVNRTNAVVGNLSSQF